MAELTAGASQSAMGSLHGGAPAFALVFEGGGAKGVAYVGALRALERRGLRIGATAGASAGAITATLVAAGFSAERLERELPAGLKHLQAAPTTSSGGSLIRLLENLRFARRIMQGLRLTGAAFDIAGVHAWLSGLLCEQVHAPSSAEVTFEELYRATGIELHVVAANVSRCEQIVFSHYTTPTCQVVDAVVASSAIPGAFLSGKLIVDESSRPHPQRLHTIVDGGVWANYPDFVFTDASFREFHDLPPLRHQVLGFLLEEFDASLADPEFGQLDPRPARTGNPYATAKFVTRGVPRKHPRTEALLASEQPPRRISWLERTGVALRSFGLVGAAAGVVAPAFVAWARRPAVFFFGFAIAFLLLLISTLAVPRTERGLGRDDCWPRAPLAELLGDAMEMFRPWVVYFALAVPGLMVVVTLARDPGVVDVSSMGERAARSFVALLSLLVVWGVGYMLTVLVLMVGLLEILRRPLRDSAWGIVRTYGAGPGAPRWRGRASGDDVVRIPIPREVSTLSFAVGEMSLPVAEGGTVRVLAELLRVAERSAGRQLDRILERRAGGAQA